MTIRRLQAPDAPAYRALRLRALREHPEAFTSSYEEDEREPPESARSRLVSPGTQFWGAFQDEQLCGMVGLVREARAKSRHKATVVAMYVAPESAGRGLGRAMLDALIAQARADGIESLLLTVTEGNDPARRLYEAAGFRSFGIEPRAIKVAGQLFAKNHMVLDLASP